MRCGRYLALERLSHPDRAPHPLPRAARQVALRTVCPGWKERYDAASKGECKNKGDTCAERVASEPCMNTVVDFAGIQGVGE